MRVRYYLQDLNFIRNNFTKHLFYLQLRSNLITCSIKCNSEKAIALGGLALQAEFGDYIPKCDYFLPEHYLSPRHLNSESVVSLIEKHSELRGLKREMAETQFVSSAIELPEYGYHFHTVLQNKNDPESCVWLGISASGINVFEENLLLEDREPTQNYLWSDIQQFSYTRHYFSLTPKTYSITGKLVKYMFHTGDPLKSQYLFNMSVCHHRFFSKLIYCGTPDLLDCASGPSSLTSKSGLEFDEIHWDLKTDQLTNIAVAAIDLNSISPIKAQPSFDSSSSIIIESKMAIKPLPMTTYQQNVIKGIVDPSVTQLVGSTREGGTIYKTVCLSKDLDNNSVGLTLTCGHLLQGVGTFVESVTPNSPAAQQHISPGNEIVAVNHRNVRENSYLEVADLIQNLTGQVLITVATATEHSALNLNESLNDSWHDALEDCPEMKNMNGDYQSPPVPNRRRKKASLPTPPSELFNNNSFENGENNCLEPIENNFNTVLNNDQNGEFKIRLAKIQNSFGFRVAERFQFGNKFERGVFVHSVIPQGSADMNGILRPGDKLLKINGCTTDGLSYAEAVLLLKKCPSMGELIFHRYPPEECSDNPDMIAKWGRRGSRTSLTSLPDQNTGPPSPTSTSSSSRSKSVTPPPYTRSVSHLGIPTTDPRSRVSPVERRKQSSPSRSPVGSPSIFNEAPPGFRFKDVIDISDSAFTDNMQRYTTFKNINQLPPLSPVSSHKTNGNAVFHRSESAPALITVPRLSSGGAELDVVPEDYSLSNFDSVFEHDQVKPNTNCQLGTTADKYKCSEDTSQEEEFFNASGNSSLDDRSLDTNANVESYASSIDSDDKPVPKPRRKRKSGLLENPEDVYKYLNAENTFEVSIEKCSRGLGLCIFGGKELESHGPVCQLIRIRQLYPLQPAFSCGQLEIGDVILEVNGLNMIGLTHMEALETLRVAPTIVALKVYRPTADIMPPVSFYAKDMPTSATNTLDRQKSMSSGSLQHVGEIELTLKKHEGSLGFSVFHHSGNNNHPPGIYVKALTREPALLDGRMQPGDRIMLVNEKDISELSHAEAIALLRSEGDIVNLKLYRSEDPNSLDDHHPPAKPLRQEAREMLGDRAKRKSEVTRKDRGLRRHSSKSSSGEESSLSAASVPNYPTEFATNSLLGSSLDRNSRPKSLDLLRKSDSHKQRDTDESLFHRQASVVVDLSEKQNGEEEGQGLLKWRGTSLLQDDESVTQPAVLAASVKSEDKPEGPPPPPPKRLASLPCFNSADPNFKLSRSDLTTLQIGEEMFERVFVEIDRGWHGRLGFSLADDLPLTAPFVTPRINSPVVKAIYDGSVAQRDGRIRIGDRLFEVNGESLLNKKAVEVIDLLRKTRGKMRLILIRAIEQPPADSTC